jgi:hypothetical protein
MGGLSLYSMHGEVRHGCLSSCLDLSCVVVRDLHKSRSLGGLCVARWSFRKFIFMQMQFDLFTEI